MYSIFAQGKKKEEKGITDADTVLPHHTKPHTDPHQVQRLESQLLLHCPRSHPLTARHPLTLTAQGELRGQTHQHPHHHHLLLLLHSAALQIQNH